MIQKRDIAIILRVTPFEERHRIVVALTEAHGKITAMAKNSVASRRFGGALEPFAASEWLFTEKPGHELVFLSEAHIKKSYEGLRKDFERLSMASVLNELMLRVAPQQEPCEELFRLHANALATLEEVSIAKGGLPLSILNAYLAKVLQWNGSQPRLHACLGCETSIETLDLRLSLSCRVADAGWVCEHCRENHTHTIENRGAFEHSLLRITPAAIQDFFLSLRLPIRQISAQATASRAEHQDLFKFLEALFIYHVPGFDQQPLKGLRFLDLKSSVLPHAENFR